MFELFSDIFTYKDNFLLRVDARAKLLVALAGLAAIMLSNRMLLPLVFFCLSTSVLLILRIPVRLIVARLAPSAGVALVLMTLKTFFSGTVPFFTINAFGLQFTATHDGFTQGLLLGTRVLGAVGLVILLGFVTPAYRIFQAFRWLRVPEEWLDIAVLVYRYIFVLLERTADLAAAQRLRLGFTGMVRSVNTVSMLAGATLLNSLDQAMRVHESMLLRCYKGSMCSGAVPGLTRRDTLFIALSIFVIGTAYLLLEGTILP